MDLCGGTPMGLRGTGANVITFERPDDTVDAFYTWHTLEHLPERIGLPGFERCRRYVSVSGSAKFLVLHEVENIEVLASAVYLERLNNPTVQTREVVRQSVS